MSGGGTFIPLDKKKPIFFGRDFDSKKLFLKYVHDDDVVGIYWKTGKKYVHDDDVVGINTGKKTSFGRDLYSGGLCVLKNDP